MKRTDQIESIGMKLKTCCIISLGISTSVLAGRADSCAINSASDRVPDSTSGCAINSASINMVISDNDSRDMLVMSVVVKHSKTNAVGVV